MKNLTQLPRKVAPLPVTHGFLCRWLGILVLSMQLKGAVIGQSEGPKTSPVALEKFSKRTSSGPLKMSYHIAMPSSSQLQKLNRDSSELVPLSPLLVLFSPRGDGQRILEPVAPAANRYGWIAVGVDRLKNGAMDTRLMIRMEDEVLEDIFERVPHDPKRVYLGGLSGGAMRAFSLTVRRKQDTYAGVLSMGGWLGGTQYARRSYPKGLAVAMIAGDKDLGAHQWSRHDAAVFNRLEGRVQMFVFPGGHEMAPTGIIRKAIKWFDRDWRDYH